MASTNKTPKLGLNQWEPGDEVLRTDFNADNLAIEALSLRCPLVTGFFVGDGTDNREISVGFKPSFAIIMGRHGTYHKIFCVSPKGNYVIISEGGEKTEPGRYIALSSKGFTIALAQFCNANGQNTFYIAYR